MWLDAWEPHQCLLGPVTSSQVWGGGRRPFLGEAGRPRHEVTQREDRAQGATAPRSALACLGSLGPRSRSYQSLKYVILGTLLPLLPHHVSQLGFQAVQYLLTELGQSYPLFQVGFGSGTSGDIRGV